MILSQRGIILISVLLFLQVFAILSLFVMETVLLEIKMTRYFKQKNNLLLAEQKALSAVENNLLKKIPDCIVPVVSAAELKQKTLDFWQTFSSCAGNFSRFQYYYVVEFLGHDVCAVVTPSQKIAAYYRISLLMTTENLQSLLQTILIRPETSSESCQTEMRTVTQGRQMWREIET